MSFDNSICGVLMNKLTTLNSSRLVKSNLEPICNILYYLLRTITSKTNISTRL